MKRPVATEHDLLALIEGRLSRERAEIVRAALRENPALLRRVQAMVRDRETLRSMGGASCPPGVVKAAMAQALEERSRGKVAFALDDVDHASEDRSDRWARRGPVLIAASIGLMVVAAAAILLLQALPDRQPSLTGGSMGYSIPEGATQADLEEILARRRAEEAAGLIDSEINPPRPVPVEIVMGGETLEDTDAATEGPIQTNQPDAIAADERPVRMLESEIAHAVTLLRAGRLRLVVETENVLPPALEGPWAWSRAPMDHGAIANSEPREDLASPADHARQPHERFHREDSSDASSDGDLNRFRAVLDVDPEDDAAVRRMVSALIERLRTAEDGSERVVRIVEARDATRASEAENQLDPLDILWWGRAPADWRRDKPLTVDVRRAPPESSSASTP